jgi:hypothetical protein
MLVPQLLIAASGPPGHQEPAIHWLQLRPNVPAGTFAETFAGTFAGKFAGSGAGHSRHSTATQHTFVMARTYVSSQLQSYKTSAATSNIAVAVGFCCCHTVVL